MNHLGGMVCLDYVEWLLRVMFMVVQPWMWPVPGGPARDMVVQPSESALVDCHPGTERFDRPSCLVSFQCNLVVIWALPRMSRLWGFFLLSDIGW